MAGAATGPRAPVFGRQILLDLRKIGASRCVKGVRFHGPGSTPLTRVWVISYDGGNVEGAETPQSGQAAKSGLNPLFFVSGGFPSAGRKRYERRRSSENRGRDPPRKGDRQGAHLRVHRAGSRPGRKEAPEHQRAPGGEDRPHQG